MQEISKNPTSEKTKKKTRGNSKSTFWVFFSIIVIVIFDAVTDELGIISSLFNDEHKWYENIINEFTPAVSAETEEVGLFSAIFHGLAFPINFIINLFMDHPYKLETKDWIYNIIFWVTAAFECLKGWFMIRRLFKKQSKANRDNRRNKDIPKTER